MASTTRRNGMLLVVLLSGQLLLMSAGVRGAAGSTVFESWTMRVSAPVIGLANLISGGFHGAFTAAKDLVTAHSRNAELIQELHRLRTEVERLRESAAENDRLRNLLLMRSGLVPRSIGGSVVTSVLTDQMRMIVVDRGSDDAVRVDLPVVTWGGAVGRVVAVDTSYSKVRLLNDPSSGVAGIVQQSRAQGMVFGRVDGGLDLRWVPRFSDVSLGDRVVTSGVDGIFPRGFGIGRVESIEAPPDGSMTIRLEPQIDFSALEEVLILLDPVAGEALLSAEPEDAS